MAFAASVPCAIRVSSPSISRVVRASATLCGRTARHGRTGLPRARRFSSTPRRWGTLSVASALGVGAAGAGIVVSCDQAADGGGTGEAVARGADADAPSNCASTTPAASSGGDTRAVAGNGRPSLANLSTGAKVVLAVVGGAVGAITLIAIPFLVVPWLPRAKFGALPYMPTSMRRVNVMLDSLPQSSLRPPKGSGGAARRFIDLGSGDGVAVIAAAKRGMRAEGVELNPALVAISKFSAWRQGVSPRRRGLGEGGVDAAGVGSASFRMQNLFDVNLSPFDVILIFGVKPLMARLSDKLQRELRPGTFVVSHKFRLPEEAWRELSEEDSMWLYHYPTSLHLQGPAPGQIDVADPAADDDDDQPETGGVARSEAA